MVAISSSLPAFSRHEGSLRANIPTQTQVNEDGQQNLAPTYLMSPDVLYNVT